ncbi:MAG: SDR family oxidoreductase [Firmicutes bacterium]|nr:SDR family oxidoreductase [Bacillota bacterium]
MSILKGRVALVTGASRGIGKAIAVMLAEHGVNLAINSSSLENLEIVAQELYHTGVEIFICPANLAEKDAPANIIKDVIAHFGRLDILINNAGIAIPKPLAETTADEWDLHMAVNARAPFLLCKEALTSLKKSDYATIINISSVVGHKGYINQGAYAASKHALMGMTKVLAQEVHNYGIRVHAVSPGGVATDMVMKTRPDLDASELISPAEIAEIVLFLLTHRGASVIDEINIRRASNTPWK